VLDVVRRQVERVRQGPPGGLLTAAIAGAVWSSSSAMSAIIYTLNRAFDLEETRPWWQTRLLAIALTLMLAVFTLGRLVAGWFGVLQWPLTVGLVVLAVDLVYHLAPDAETRWTWLTPGSALATALWMAGSFGFKLYVSKFADFGAVYGSIGGVTVLLLWCYLSGLAILVGAELNSEIDHALPERDREPVGPRARPRIGAAAERQPS
jgi:membrane protein